MDLIVAQASKLKAQVRLGRAVSAFYESLDTENKAVFDSYRDAAHSEAPGLGDIRLIVAEIDRKARKPCGDRFKRVFEALQQFLAVGDVLIGSTQNFLAAGVWSVARLTVIVCFLHASIERELLIVRAGHDGLLDLQRCGLRSLPRDWTVGSEARGASVYLPWRGTFTLRHDGIFHRGC